MLLTKHEGETFLNQTVYIAGQAFIRCKFIACTLILREAVYVMQDCSFERCNWHLDWVLMWGNPRSVAEVKGLVEFLEAVQRQLPPEQLGTEGATQATQSAVTPPAPAETTEPAKE